MPWRGVLGRSRPRGVLKGFRIFCLRVTEMCAMQNEITVRETKPATEWILGRAVRKVSPKRDHALIQGRLLVAFLTWARDGGEVGTEWCFRVTPPGEVTRPLVPDVSFVSRARLHGLSRAEKQEPLLAPDVAVEVRSPSDRQVYIDEKIRVYLASGSTLVIVVDPRAEDIIAFDVHGSQRFVRGETFAHPAIPGFTLDLEELFAVLA
jgi:Uma2 family endonuclease